MIAVIGGTGAQGRGLAMRWAIAGEDVIIGSRWGEKAKKAAAEMSKQVGKKIRGMSNLEAASAADVVVLSVPFEAMKEIVGEIAPALTAGKILLSVVVPIKFKGGVVSVELCKAGSAAEKLEKLAPRGVKLISAFQTVGAARLQDLKRPIECDIVVCGDDDKAKRVVMKLAEKIQGVRAIDGGPLCNSRLVEPVVALLVELTRRKKVPGVSIRFEGLE